MDRDDQTTIYINKEDRTRLNRARDFLRVLTGGRVSTHPDLIAHLLDKVEEDLQNYGLEEVPVPGRTIYPGMADVS